jgi:hypothetical protein
MADYTLTDAIRHVQAMRDETHREQIGSIVAEVLTQEIRVARADELPRSAPYPDYMSTRAEADEIVGRMSTEELEAAYDEKGDDYWETANSEAHEWYDLASGETAAFERVLDVLQSLANGIEPAQGAMPDKEGAPA